MFQELAMNFKAFQSGSETFKMRFYSGHDGSMVRLASGLGFGKVAPLRWPALGSEVVMEVRTKYAVRRIRNKSDVRRIFSSIHLFYPPFLYPIPEARTTLPNFITDADFWFF